MTPKPEDQRPISTPSSEVWDRIVHDGYWIIVAPFAFPACVGLLYFFNFVVPKIAAKLGGN
jgi:hypothetical protein